MVILSVQISPRSASILYSFSASLPLSPSPETVETIVEELSAMFLQLTFQSLGSSSSLSLAV